MFDCLLLLHLKPPRRNVWRILATKMNYKIHYFILCENAIYFASAMTVY